MVDNNKFSEPHFDYKSIERGYNPFIPESQYIFFACHPDDFSSYFSVIYQDLCKTCSQNCNLFYVENLKESLSFENKEDFLLQMRFFVIPITFRFLETDNDAKDFLLPFALNHGIPVLPILVEKGLNNLFNKICGDIQCLDRNDSDPYFMSSPEKPSPEEKKQCEAYFTFYTSYEAALFHHINFIFTKASANLFEEYTKEVKEIKSAFKPHIFFSYRKKDRPYLSILMRVIRQNVSFRDIGAWYDENLIPGEEFTAPIQEAIETCSVVILVVTPAILEKNNYVLDTEYPTAQKAGKKIIPIEMDPLTPEEKALLKEKYKNFPDLIDPHDPKLFIQTLFESFSELDLNIEEIDNTPSHLCRIATGYLFGINVERNLTLGINLLISSAEQGAVTAQNILYDCYDMGIGLQKNPRKAVEWCTKAAKQGNAQAQYNLGVSYDKGKGIKQNKTEGVKWLTMAAEQGFAWAQNYLGLVYGLRGTKSDNETAVKWYNLAAEQGVHFAQFILAQFYFEGIGVTKNVEKALYWGEMAADQGNVDAQLYLGDIYSNGEIVDKNNEIAAGWYAKAAMQGSPIAQTKLGLLCKNGIGIKQDNEKAIRLFKKASDLGNADAETNLGLCYLTGDCVPQNRHMAKRLFIDASKQKYSPAYYWMGKHYLDEAKQGNAVKSTINAAEWFIKAKNAGYPEASEALSMCTKFLRENAQTNKAAVTWLEKMGNKGIPEAQYDLGICYFEGLGVKKNLREARNLWSKAAEQGYEKARKALADEFKNKRK